MMLGNDDEPDLADVLRDSTFVRYAEDGIYELPGGWQLLSVRPLDPDARGTPRGS